jgi:hypothetical protein
VNRLIFRSKNYGNDNNNGSSDRDNGPPPGENHGNNGDNAPPFNNYNDTSTTVPSRVGTHAKSVQANIRPKTTGRNIRGNVADNDDISSVSSTSSISEENIQPVSKKLTLLLMRTISRGIQT